MQRFGTAFLDYWKRADKLLWLVMLAISGYSLILLKTIPNSSGRSYSYFAIQVMAILAGYLAAFIITAFDYRSLAWLWWLAAGFCLLLLIYTYFKGTSVQSSGGMDTRAWIKLPGGLTFQPSELVKIAFMLTFAKHVSVLKEHGLIDRFIHVMLLGVHALIPVLWMFIIQKDMGSAVVFFFMFLVMAFTAGVQLRYFALVFGLIGVALPVAWQTGLIADYQKARLTDFLYMDSGNVDIDKIYQQLQGRISIGSGQITGRGLFTAPRVQKNAVPVQQSDYIFAVAAESLGLIGSLLLIGLLLALMIRTIHVARKATDDLGSTMCYGFFAMIAIQTISNIGMCLCLLPVMGVTLPFFSAGGSSSACLYLGFGLVECVAMHPTISDHIHIRRRAAITSAI